MGKPAPEVFERFARRFQQLNEEMGLKQYLVPYFISSHPGCELADAVLLAEYIHQTGRHPEQVQDFYPTPGTLSTAMFYTGLDPRDMSPVYVPRDPHEKAMQRALIQYRDPKNYDLVTEALIKANRRDLIGTGKNCLLRPRHGDTRFAPPSPPQTAINRLTDKTKRAKHGRTSQPPAPQSRRWTGEPPKKRGKR